MKLNWVDNIIINNPIRNILQNQCETKWFERLSAGALAGKHALEVGCGGGVGAEAILDRLGADQVTAFDLDEAMIKRARRRLRGRPVTLSVGDVCDIELGASSVDAVVDYACLHHVPDWQKAVAELARVLRPGGLVLFEETPGHMLDKWAFRTFTAHPRENRFEADEFAAELARHGLHGTAQIERHYGGLFFVGAALKN